MKDKKERVKLSPKFTIGESATGLILALCEEINEQISGAEYKDCKPTIEGVISAINDSFGENNIAVFMLKTNIIDIEDSELGRFDDKSNELSTLIVKDTCKFIYTTHRKLWRTISETFVNFLKLIANHIAAQHQLCATPINSRTIAYAIWCLNGTTCCKDAIEKYINNEISEKADKSAAKKEASPAEVKKDIKGKAAAPKKELATKVVKAAAKTTKVVPKKDTKAKIAPKKDVPVKKVAKQLEISEDEKSEEEVEPEEAEAEAEPEEEETEPEEEAEPSDEE